MDQFWGFNMHTNIYWTVCYLVNVLCLAYLRRVLATHSTLYTKYYGPHYVCVVYVQQSNLFAFDVPERGCRQQAIKSTQPANIISENSCELLYEIVCTMNHTKNHIKSYFLCTYSKVSFNVCKSTYRTNKK